MTSPDASPSSRLSTGSFAEISALAIADGTKGPGTAPYPNSASTIASSRIPKPCPPTVSDRCTPCRPCSAAAFQYGGGLEIGVSSAWCRTSDGATRLTRSRTESARSLCSERIAMGMLAGSLYQPVGWERGYPGDQDRWTGTSLTRFTKSRPSRKRAQLSTASARYRRMESAVYQV